MKSNARKAQKPHATEEAGNHTAKPFVVGAKQRQCKHTTPNKIRKSELQSRACEAIDPVEFAVMAPIREGLRRNLDDRFEDAAIQCKLMPSLVLSGLLTAQLFARVALAARAARRITGVPSSVLISMADLAASWHCMDAKGFDVFTGKTNDYFNVGENFAGVEASFLDQAIRLDTDRRFRPVMRAAKNREKYLEALRKCSLWDERGRLDIVGFITDYGLEQCDEAAEKITSLDLGL